MGDEIRYPGFRHGKCYTMGLDSRAIELGKPIDLTYTKIENAAFELQTLADDVKVKATWHEPIIPDSVISEVAKEITRSDENRFIQRVYGLPDHYIINNGATILFWKDGTKTIVKRSKDEKFDKRLGFLIAYFQKHCGMSKTKANKFLDNLVVADVEKKEQ